MKTFNIPDVAERFRLSEPFELKLLNIGDNQNVIRSDRRHDKFITDFYALRNYQPEEWEAFHKLKLSVVLPTDTILSIARVYIRKGASDWSSVTFNIVECPLKSLTLKSKGGTWFSGQRKFFLHLDDVNTMPVERIDP